VAAAGALPGVLDSLNKLIELEKRITDLEQNNVYDRALAADRTRGPPRGLNDRVVTIQKRKRGA
jgi:hypothetical protein